MLIRGFRTLTHCSCGLPRRPGEGCASKAHLVPRWCAGCGGFCDGRHLALEARPEHAPSRCEDLHASGKAQGA
jgi:hypothetical protein